MEYRRTNLVSLVGRGALLKVHSICTSGGVKIHVIFDNEPIFPLAETLNISVEPSPMNKKKTSIKQKYFSCRYIFFLFRSKWLNKYLKVRII